MKLLKKFIILVFLGISCKTPTIYKNFNDYKPDSEIAIVEMDGYILKIKNDNNINYFDKLYLLEGKYLIEFKDRINLIKGAALCELKSNKKYTIEIIDKKEFPKIKKSIYIGECKEIPKTENNVFEKFLLDKKLEKNKK